MAAMQVSGNRMKMHSQHGFTLIELVIIILVIGVLATVAVQKMNTTIDTATMEQTKAEMDQLAIAILGNPNSYTSGAQASFGYVGDVGALPGNLDALAVNPGLANWHGPYIGKGFESGEYKRDGWGVDYAYNGLQLRSTGSGTTIDKQIASSMTALFSNTVTGSVVDANRIPPNASWRDSLSVQLLYPNGVGGTTVQLDTLDSDGRFTFSNVPIGNHTLRIIYNPATDTMRYSVTVLPGRTATMEIVCPADLW